MNNLNRVKGFARHFLTAAILFGFSGLSNAGTFKVNMYNQSSVTAVKFALRDDGDTALCEAVDWNTSSVWSPCKVGMIQPFTYTLSLPTRSYTASIPFTFNPNQLTSPSGSSGLQISASFGDTSKGEKYQTISCKKYLPLSSTTKGVSITFAKYSTGYALGCNLQ